MKVTKKVLSVFLAVLMVFSCITVALPTIAGAAATTGEWNALRDAVTAAGSSLTTGNYTKSGGTNSTSRTITDKTSNSAIYNVVYALYDVIEGEMTRSSSGTYSYPNALYNRMTSQMSSRLGSSVYTGNASTALNDLVSYIIRYDSFTKWTGNVQTNTASLWGTPAEYGGLSDLSAVQITVNRSRDAAIMEYDDVNAVPDKVTTSFRIQWKANRAQSGIYGGSFIGTGKKRDGWYYYGSMSQTDSVSEVATNISILKTYLNYFTPTLLELDPYTTYTYETQAALQELVNTNTTQQNNLATAVSNGSLSNTVVQYFARMY